MTIEEFEVYIKFKLMDVDLTDWNYVAVDANGEVWLYINKPTIDKNYWYESLMAYDKDESHKYIHTNINLNELGIDWKDTLINI